MASDRERVRNLYRKLLSLYPRAFRERLGESMEQTFNDVCNERRQRTERGLFGFALWLFVETAVGICKEHTLLIRQGDAMRTITKNLGFAALISFIIVLPFMILEWVNNRNPHESFPLALFGFMWLLPVAFIVILVPMVRTVRAGSSIMAKPISLLFGVAFLTLIATVWGWGLIDQLPCFLGVPNCD